MPIAKAINMKIRTLYRILQSFGWNPRATFNAIRGLPAYIRDFVTFVRACGATKVPMRIFPILGDRYEPSGVASGHYFHADLWAARRIYQLGTEKHVDIGSRIDGLISHLLTFREVEVLDIRGLSATGVTGLKFTRLDVMNCENLPKDYADSISSVHALEHFGLGRYGDSVDPFGYQKGLEGFIRLLKPGGKLLLAVPIGGECVEFNAHRIFEPAQFLNMLTEIGFRLDAFSFVDDEGGFRANVACDSAAGLTYGCGCFELTKAMKYSHQSK